MIHNRVSLKYDNEYVQLPNLDISDSSVQSDLVAALKQQRQAGPLCWILPIGAVGVLRFADVDTVLHDVHNFSAVIDPEVSSDRSDSPALTMLRSDPPEHTRLTRLARQAFTTERMGTIESRVLTIVRDLLEGIEEQESFDFITGFAEALPLQVMAELLGIAAVDRGLLLRWSQDMIHAKEMELVRDSHAPTTHEESLEVYMCRVCDERRKKPQHDMISALVHACEGKDRLSEHEIVDLAKLLFIAGTELVPRALGLALHLIITRPEPMQLLRDSPRLIVNAVEECLRYSGPLIFTRRRALHDCTLAGHAIPAGTLIAAMLTSANHDEIVFAEPDRFDITRVMDRHMAFGAGPHVCMGAGLARVEMQTALSELWARFDTIELAAPPTLKTGLMGGLAHLPLRLRKRRSAADRSGQETTRTLATATTVAEKSPEELGLKARGMERVKVAFIRELTPLVKLFVLNHPSGGTLTRFTAGSHIVLHLREGETTYRRAYSLLNAAFGDGLSYFIAVRLAEPSMGGSRYLFEKVRPGDEFEVSVPANYFPLSQDALQHVFIAGGIGITPFIAMRNELRHQGQPSELHYAFRGPETAAFVDILKMSGDPHVHFYDASQGQRLDVDSVLRRQKKGTHIYTCGPKELMDAVLRSAELLGFPSESVHTESFGAEPPLNRTEFTALCRISGLELQVPDNRTLLEVLEAGGIPVQHACLAGSCGLCQLTVLEGDLIHNDSVLTAAEKKSGRTIVACVSRARGSLVLNV